MHGYGTLVSKNPSNFVQIVIICLAPAVNSYDSKKLSLFALHSHKNAKVLFKVLSISFLTRTLHWQNICNSHVMLRDKNEEISHERLLWMKIQILLQKLFSPHCEPC